MVTLMLLLQIQAFISLNPAAFPIYRTNEPLYEIQHDVQKMLCYPADAKEKGIKGVLMVEYKVCEDGTIHNVEVVEGIDCESMRKEACRVVSSLRYDKAAIKNGKKVEMIHYVRVVFAMYSTELCPKRNEPLKKKVYRGNHYRITMDERRAILTRKKSGVKEVLDTLRYHERGDYVLRGRVSCVVKSNNQIRLYYKSNRYNYVNLY